MLIYSVQSSIVPAILVTIKYAFMYVFVCLCQHYSIFIDSLLSHISPPPSPRRYLSGGIRWTLTQLHGRCMGMVTSSTHICLAQILIIIQIWSVIHLINLRLRKFSKLSPGEKRALATHTGNVNTASRAQEYVCT